MEPSSTPIEQGLPMKPNEGTIDRALRVAAGLLLIILAYTGTVGLWGWIGVVPLLTGAIGWCPLYTVLGFNTCPMKQG
jgi:O-antigen ligase